MEYNLRPTHDRELLLFPFKSMSETMLINSVTLNGLVVAGISVYLFSTLVHLRKLSVIGDVTSLTIFTLLSIGAFLSWLGL